MRISDNMMTLGSLLVGGALTQGGAWLQRWWRRKDDKESRVTDRASTLEDANQARVDKACEGILDEIALVKPLAQSLDQKSVPMDGTIHPHIERMERHAVFLPDTDVRTRVSSLVNMMWFADALVYSGEDPEEDWVWIVFDTADALTELAGALLRRETPPPPPPWYAQRRELLAEIQERQRPRGRSLP